MSRSTCIIGGSVFAMLCRIPDVAPLPASHRSAAHRPRPVDGDHSRSHEPHRFGAAPHERPADSRVDLPLAREIAQREGIGAIVHGDVTPLAGGSVLTVRLLAAESGDELASFRESMSGAK